MGQQTGFRHTVLVGFLLLVPVGLAVVAIGKVLQLLRQFATYFSAIVSPERPIGVLLLDAVVVCLFVVLCFLAGLLAQRQLGQRLQSASENLLSRFLPGFGLINRILGSLRDDAKDDRYAPVTVRLDDGTQFGFEVERTAAGKVLVYIPNVPTPTSGALLFVDAERVTRSSLGIRDAMRAFRQLGEGSSEAMLRPRD
jgi:uncharacterized membrane protein